MERDLLAERDVLMDAVLQLLKDLQAMDDQYGPIELMPPDVQKEYQRKTEETLDLNQRIETLNAVIGGIKGAGQN